MTNNVLSVLVTFAISILQAFAVVSVAAILINTDIITLDAILLVSVILLVAKTVYNRVR